MCYPNITFVPISKPAGATSWDPMTDDVKRDLKYQLQRYLIIYENRLPQNMYIRVKHILRLLETDIFSEFPLIIQESGYTLVLGDFKTMDDTSIQNIWRNHRIGWKYNKDRLRTEVVILGHGGTRVSVMGDQIKLALESRGPNVRVGRVVLNKLLAPGSVLPLSIHVRGCKALPLAYGAILDNPNVMLAIGYTANTIRKSDIDATAVVRRPAPTTGIVSAVEFDDEEGGEIMAQVSLLRQGRGGRISIQEIDHTAMHFTKILITEMRLNLERWTDLKVPVYLPEMQLPLVRIPDAQLPRSRKMDETPGTHGGDSLRGRREDRSPSPKRRRRSPSG